MYIARADTWTSFASLPMGIDAFVMLTLHGRPYVFGRFGAVGHGVGVVNTLYSCF